MDIVERTGRLMGRGFALGFGALASFELFLVLHGSNVRDLLRAAGIEL